MEGEIGGAAEVGLYIWWQEVDESSVKFNSKFLLAR